MPKNKLPRIWCRYVDDVVAVVKRDDITKTKSMLKKTIKFTVESQRNERLVHFKINIKPTETYRFTTKHVNHHESHKRAAFDSKAYIFYNILSKNDDKKWLFNFFIK